jgi:transcriptional regulator with XRE-family HTH domain
MRSAITFQVIELPLDLANVVAMKPAFGSMLSEWRSVRRASQLDLAETSGVSQRHISFIESGRAQPSRQLILKLARALDLPLPTRNELLIAAGFAPLYAARSLDLSEMRHVQQALVRLMDHHEPYPALVTDADWNIVMQNESSKRLVTACISSRILSKWLAAGPLNFMRIMFAPDGLRPHIRNWHEMKVMLLDRLSREARANPHSRSAALWREFRDFEAPATLAEGGPLDPVLVLELAVGGLSLRLFASFLTFGTAQDLTLRNLRVDMSFPADEATRQILNAAATTGNLG